MKTIEEIEKTDRRRWHTSLWLTVGFVLFAVNTIVGTSFGQQRPPDAVIGTLGVAALVAMIITLVSFALYSVNELKIRRDPALKAALNNEMVIHCRNRSLKWGGYVALFTLFAIYAFEPQLAPWITVRLTCLVVAFPSITTIMVTNLIWLRR